MGVHVGTAQERDENYFGTAVNRAARLMSAAHGGQLVVSLAVQELVRDRLAPDLVLVDLGEHSLRGLERADQVLQVSIGGLVSEFPPLRTSSEVEANLPVALTSFVGRTEETKLVAAEVLAERVVTLTGVGGVGKTRLAIETGWSLLDEFADGAWLVELAPLADGRLLSRRWRRCWG